MVENIQLLSVKIKEVLDANPEYKEYTKISTLLAKIIHIDSKDEIDIFDTGKEYVCIEDAILEKISELDNSISRDEKEIIDKYNLLYFDADIKHIELKPEEVKVEEKIAPIVEETIEEKETIQLVKRYRVNSEIRINKCKVYVSVDDEKEYARLTGKFYIFNNSIVNGRIKISKRPADKSKVVGWVDLKNVEVVKK